MGRSRRTWVWMAGHHRRGYGYFTQGGREFTPENTRIDGRGHRSCRACARLLHRGYYRDDLEGSRKYVRDKQRKRRSTNPDDGGQK